MKYAVVLLLLLGLTGCISGQETQPGLFYLHDDVHHVSCWRINSAGIACMTDKEMGQ